MDPFRYIQSNKISLPITFDVVPNDAMEMCAKIKSLHLIYKVSKFKG